MPPLRVKDVRKGSSGKLYRVSSTGHSARRLTFLPASSLRSTASAAAKAGVKVRLVYQKKEDDSVVVRYVSPYEFKQRYLYGKHQRTKSFIKGRVLDASLSGVASDPDYPVKV